MTQSSPRPVTGDFQADFEQLTQSFEAIATITSPTRKRFSLNKTAPYYGLPRAEFRKLFEVWLLEQAQGGQH
jgi:hypothetical protein